MSLPAIEERLRGQSDRFRKFWETEDQVLADSEQALRQGDVTIEELPEVDLAIVRVAEKRAPQTIHRFTGAGKEACHPMAIHNATLCNRVLILQGRRYALMYRYESWVQFASRRPPKRVSLDELAKSLNALEQAPGEWCAESANDVVPRLYLDGAEQSSLSPERFIDETRRQLNVAPVAWDPWDWKPAA